MSESDKQKHLIQDPITYTQTRTIRLPADELRNKRVITGYENDAITAEYKMLRTQVLRLMKANGWRTLAVTSCMPGEGKSITAINLAYSLAREVNQTVLLADFDLRKPSIAGYFGVEPPKGLLDHVNEGVPLNEVLFNPGTERMVILPNTKTVHNSSEMLSSPQMLNLVQELKDRYASRIIIFDMPPLLAADDMLAFSANVDCVLLVVEEGKTRKEDLVRALDMLKGTNILGTVLNKSRKPALPDYYY